VSDLYTGTYPTGKIDAVHKEQMGRMKGFKGAKGTETEWLTKKGKVRQEVTASPRTLTQKDLRSFSSLTDISGVRGTGTRHVTVDADVGSDLAPTKSRPFNTTKGKYPMTGVPISAEEPARGEYTAVGQPSRRNDSN
jgi:hypothetical protein